MTYAESCALAGTALAALGLAIWAWAPVAAWLGRGRR